MVKEIWKQFRDTDYMVSSLGRVVSMKNKRFWKIMKPGIDKDGYERIDICHALKIKHFPVHKIVIETFNPTANKNLVTNHKDGDKRNNKIDNLEWCTVADNTRHAYRTGLAHGPRGSTNGGTTMNEALVLVIKRLCQRTSTRQIADYFELPYSRVADIKAERSWAHICV